VNTYGGKWTRLYVAVCELVSTIESALGVAVTKRKKPSIAISVETGIRTGGTVTRAAWVDAGNDPSYAQLAAQGITEPYFDLREARLTPAYLDGVKSHTFVTAVGVYAVASWFNFTPEEFAEWVDARLRAIGWKGNAWVDLDLEVEPVYAVAALIRWRQLRPTRRTTFTLEGHKAATFSVAQVQAIINAEVSVGPQCYNGGMTQVWDTWAMCSEWVARGVPVERLHPYVDAAHLPYWWTGTAFTQGRLPA
jgi:hypothetical protein